MEQGVYRVERPKKSGNERPNNLGLMEINRESWIFWLDKDSMGYSVSSFRGDMDPIRMIEKETSKLVLQDLLSRGIIDSKEELSLVAGPDSVRNALWDYSHPVR